MPVNRKALTMSIETIGKLILLVLIIVAVLIFILSGVSEQINVFNETGSSVIDDLSGKVGDASQSLVIS